MILQDMQEPTQKRKSPKERIQAIAENWFLCEPLLFNAYCTHKTVVNEKLSIPFRTGNMKIEYNPIQVEALSDSQIEDYLALNSSFNFRERIQSALKNIG